MNKRRLFALSFIGLVLAFGLITLVQAQRSPLSQSGETPAGETSANPLRTSETAKRNTLPRNDLRKESAPRPLTIDPFARPLVQEELPPQTGEENDRYSSQAEAAEKLPSGRNSAGPSLSADRYEQSDDRYAMREGVRPVSNQEGLSVEPPQRLEDDYNSSRPAANSPPPSRYGIETAPPAEINTENIVPPSERGAEGADSPRYSPQNAAPEVSEQRNDYTNNVYPPSTAEGGKAPALMAPMNEAQPVSDRMAAPPIHSREASEANEMNQGPEGKGQPGLKQLEGAQTPSLTVQKFAPPEVQVGKAALFRTVVRNTGTVVASEVEVLDLVPRGARLVNTNPKAIQNARGELVWNLGTLRPGEESAAEMEIMPVSEGEIGSVAVIRFGAETSAKSISTKPQLVVEMTAPSKALIGESIKMLVKVSNPGSGVASGVVLEEHVPPGLQHTGGSELEYPIGNLKPGESKQIELQLTAAAAGPTVNVLSARAEAGLRAEARLDLEVVAPKLDLAMEGPKRRFLEREATYQVSVSNPGTAPARQVELVAYLPPGLKFVSANNAGHYDEASREVSWRLAELPVRERGSVELVTLPVEAGQHQIKIRGSALKSNSVEKEQAVTIEGVAAILFQVSSLANPIEIGGETTYEVRVLNQGSKASSNLRLTAQLPRELQALTAEGPTRFAIEGNQVVFEGLARLAPKAETIYRVRVKGLEAGDLRARFQLLTDEMQSPVLKEESTRVYADE